MATTSSSSKNVKFAHRYVAVQLLNDSNNDEDEARKSGDGKSSTAIRYKTPKIGVKPMVSIRTLTWTFILMQLVISCACFVASLAIISAKMNSDSQYLEKQYVSIEWWLFCTLSFSMIVNTIIAMCALSEHNKYLLIPHILFLILCNLLSCYILYYTILNFDSTDFNWYIGLIVMIVTEPNQLRQAIKKSGKISFCTLLTCQAILSIFLLIGVLSPILLDKSEFVHDNVRITTICLAVITGFWLCSTIFAIFVSVLNCQILLKIHLFTNVTISIIYFLKFLILLVDGSLFPILLSVLVNIINFLTLYYEFHFLQFLSSFQL